MTGKCYLSAQILHWVHSVPPSLLSRLYATNNEEAVMSYSLVHMPPFIPQVEKIIWE